MAGKQSGTSGLLAFGFEVRKRAAEALEADDGLEGDEGKRHPPPTSAFSPHTRPQPGVRQCLSYAQHLTTHDSSMTMRFAVAAPTAASSEASPNHNFMGDSELEEDPPLGNNLMPQRLAELSSLQR